MRERSGELTLELVYDRDRIEGQQIGELASQLELVLQQVVGNPTRALSSVSLRGNDGRRRLPDPNSPLDPNQGEALTTAFARQADRFPSRLAVADPHVHWTYSELSARAARIAQELQRKGLEPGDRVAVYACREAALAAALLGVLQAGGAFTILDSAYPGARLVRCLDTAKPKAWLLLEAAGTPTSELRQRAAKIPIQLSVPRNPPQAPLPAPVHSDPDALAYVAFTSGSTGVPKAVGGTHRPVTHFLSWQAQRFALEASDRFACLSGLSHDPLLRDVFAPLSLGASLHFPPRGARKDPGALSAWLRASKIAVIHLTPGLSRLISHAPAEHALPTLRLAFFGGDRLFGRDAHCLRERAPNVRCINFYGTTETPQGAAYHEVAAGELAGDAQAPIGRGIPNVQLLVLNSGGRLAGVGEVGELWVRTPYLTQGYLHAAPDRPPAFQPGPSGEPWDRVYRTGDLARYASQGDVELAGRADRQAQVRGYRVEPLEIENALRDLDGVNAAAVLAEADTLLAWVTGNAQGSELRGQLALTLPSHSVPARVTVLESLPLTPNGKVDFAQLQRAQPTPKADARVFAEPRTQTEKQVAELWRTLMDLERVDVRDDFFQLGGHSLLAVRMLSLLGEELGRVLPVKLLLGAPTVERLAEALHHEDWVAEESLVVVLQPGDERPPFWLIHPIGGHVVFAHRLTAYFDPEQPVYGIQARGLDGRKQPFESLQEMAAHYVDLVRSKQPKGPYLLGGPSFGGRVCYEMAQQLDAHGEHVALLAMIDTYGQGYPTHKAAAGRVGDHVRELLSLSWRERATYLKARVSRRIQGKATSTRLYDIDRPGWDASELVDRVRHVIMANHRCAASYTTLPYPGSIVLFRANRTPDYPGLSYEDTSNGWARFAQGGVRVEAIDSTHQRILDEPAVAQLGRALRDWLDRVHR